VETVQQLYSITSRVRLSYEIKLRKDKFFQNKIVLIQYFIQKGTLKDKKKATYPGSLSLTVEVLHPCEQP